MTAPTAPTTAPAPITVGSTVVHDGADATITRVHRPGDEHSPVDLMFYEADDKPRFKAGVERGWQAGQFLTRQDYDRVRVKTPLEVVAEQVALGNLHAPIAGNWVVYGRDVSKDVHVVQIQATRARIRTVLSMDQLDLDVFPPETPDDPFAEDRPIERNIRAWHASKDSPANRRHGYRGSFCFADEALIKDATIEREGAHRCSRCGKGFRSVTPLYVRDPKTYGVDQYHAPDAKACDGCLDFFRAEFKIPKPEATPAPAPVAVPA
jgi:hypothetical protein